MVRSIYFVVELNEHTSTDAKVRNILCEHEKHHQRKVLLNSFNLNQ